MSWIKIRYKFLILGCKFSVFKPNFHTTDIGNNPMVGMTVSVAVAVEEASK